MTGKQVTSPPTISRDLPDPKSVVQGESRSHHGPPLEGKGGLSVGVK